MVKANFNAYANYVTDSLYQWDLNQVLSVFGLNLSTAPEVHFSNANMDRAIVRQTTMINHVVNVDIPNSLLQDPLRIYAHIGIYEGNTFKVVEKIEIPIIPRKRPYDYQIQDSDGEIYSFNALENKIDNAVNCIENFLANMEQFSGNYDEFLALMQDKANKPTVVEATLFASGWSGDTYSFEATYPAATYDVEIALNNTATADQVEAFNSAQIVGSATANIIKAYGDVPTVNIPIIVKAVMK